MIVSIWKVKWIASPGSDPMIYYFKNDDNIEPTFLGFNPPFPTSSYTKEEIEVNDDAWEYSLCID